MQRAERVHAFNFRSVTGFFLRSGQGYSGTGETYFAWVWVRLKTKKQTKVSQQVLKLHIPHGVQGRQTSTAHWANQVICQRFC